MLVKDLSDIANSDIWELSENDDIIITKKGSDDQRVLINFKTYPNVLWHKGS